MTVKLLTEQHLEFSKLKRGGTGSSESSLVKMLQCWKSHVLAHLVNENSDLNIEIFPNLIAAHTCLMLVVGNK